MDEQQVLIENMNVCLVHLEMRMNKELGPEDMLIYLCGAKDGMCMNRNVQLTVAQETELYS